MFMGPNEPNSGNSSMPLSTQKASSEDEAVSLEDWEKEVMEELTKNEKAEESKKAD